MRVSVLEVFGGVGECHDQMIKISALTLWSLCIKISDRVSRGSVEKWIKWYGLSLSRADAMPLVAR